MSSSKQWLQSSANGGEDGGAENGATGSLAGEVALEAVMPGAAEEQLGRTTVAEIPNEGMVPNVDMTDVAEGEGRASTTPPRAGEKRTWDETGGVDVELEATVLRLMLKHGFPMASSSSSGRSQEIQTELSGEVSSVSKRSQNKMKGVSSASSICGEGGDEKEGKSVDDLKAAPTAIYTMDEEEILELDAERIRQVSEDAERMCQVSEEDGFQKDERLIKVCDGTTWEWHFLEDGRQYYYCLDTGESKWTLPEAGDKIADNKVTGVPSGNELRPRHLSL